MEPWRIALIAAVVVILIPNLILMRQVNALREQGDSAALKKKQTQLTWCMRLLIAVFILTLGITMFLHFSKLAAM